MKVKGIEFGPVLGASGIQGFFGEGYPYHRYLAILPGFDFSDMTFVAKTMTLLPNKGNMPMADDLITPREFKPRCIEVNIRRALALNAVGLSNPGAGHLFCQGKWQQREKPFFLSFMSIKKNVKDRLLELREFVGIFSQHLPEFKAPVGLQINFSCPNVGLESHPWQEMRDEVWASLEIASLLQIPLMPKFNVLTPMRVVNEIVHHHCDAICVSNTIPWGALPDKIHWQEFFGGSGSPLEAKGFSAGGLSGAPLLPLVCEWVRVARRWGIKVPINAGGGILHPQNVDQLKDVGASSVFVGSVAMLRPWRVKSIIKRAHEIFA